MTIRQVIKELQIGKPCNMTADRGSLKMFQSDGSFLPQCPNSTTCFTACLQVVPESDRVRGFFFLVIFANLFEVKS